MGTCKALVWSRTKSTDYRFISLPEGFTVDDELWVNENIGRDLLKFHYLLDKARDKDESRAIEPIYKCFENDNYYVLGVITTVLSLSDSVADIATQSPYEDILKDGSFRLIYGFFAYVIEKNANKLKSTKIKNTLSFYSELYRYVVDDWDGLKYTRYSDIHNVFEIQYNESESIPDTVDSRFPEIVLSQVVLVLVGVIFGLFLSLILHLEALPTMALIVLSPLLMNLLGIVVKKQNDKYL